MQRRVRCALGVDLGGNSVRCGVVTASGKLLAERTEDTASCASRERFLCFVADEGKRSRELAGSSLILGGVGIAIPGILSGDRCQVVRAVNLPFLQGWHLRDALADVVGGTAQVVTDAEAATWGEYVARRPDVDRFAHLRIGTGIALGVVVHGELLRLDAGRTEHLDVLVVDRTDAAVACSCGLRGCLEAIASGRALERSAVAVGLETVGSVQVAHDAGMARAVRLVDDATGAVVAALDNIVERFGPSVVCIGGGVATHLPSLVRRVTELWRRDTAQHPARAAVTIVPAALGDMSGVIGAGLLALGAE